MRLWPDVRWHGSRARRAALRYAEHGWPVVPGAFETRAGRFDCGILGCRTIACHPALPDWQTRASTDPETLRTWWRSNPYTVLLATGHAFDILEVPFAIGRLAAGAATAAGRTARGPLAVAPAGRWMFWVRPGHALLPELAEQADVVLHGPGSWVPAPPSEQTGGRVRWEIQPDVHDHRPAEPYAVQALMVAGLHTRRSRRTTARPPMPVRDVA